MSLYPNKTLLPSMLEPGNRACLVQVPDGVRGDGIGGRHFQQPHGDFRPDSVLRNSLRATHTGDQPPQQDKVSHLVAHRQLELHALACR